MNEIVLAADMGGTNLRMAAISRDGKILYQTRRETPRNARVDEIVSLICESAKECLENCQGNFLAMSIAVPAIVNVEKGFIFEAPNVPALNGFRLTETLETKLNLPCILENDANAAAVGENWLGASKNYQNSIAVTLGTGVGGGIIIDGNVLRGVDGTASEIGHICVEPFGVDCGCGSRGCVEQYSSASAIVRLARELKHEYPNSKLQANLSLSSLEVFEAGLKGDVLALEIFRQQGFYLGIALAGLVNILNPEVIVIGGGAAAAWDLFLLPMLEQIKERAYRQPAERVKIVRAALGDDAGIIGAARLAFKNISEIV